MRRVRAWHTINTDELGDETCRPLLIPLGLLPHCVGALALLTEERNWEQVGDMTPREAAEYMSAMLSTLTGDCNTLPQTLVRQSTASPCILEYSLDEGANWTPFANLQLCRPNLYRTGDGQYKWVSPDDTEPFTFYEFPDSDYYPPSAFPAFSDPAPIVGETDEEKRCNAAYAAALGLQMYYRDTWDMFTEFATNGVLSAAREIIQWAAGLIRGSLPMEIALQIAQDLYDQVGEFEADGFPNSELEAVQNILYCEASVTEDDRVEFDFSAVVATFGDELASPYPGLNFILQLFLGEAGLNAIGAVNAGAGDCQNADCFECTNASTTFDAGLDLPFFISAAFPAYLWNSGGRGVRIPNSGIGNTPCLYGTTNGTYNEIDCICDLGGECTVTGVDSWWIKNAANADVYYAFFDASQTKIGSNVSMGGVALSWGNKPWSGSVSGCRYVAVMGQGNAATILCDNVSITVA